MSEPSLVDRALIVARVDRAPAHRPPSTASVVVASIGALVGSLGVDALLVAGGTALFPSTRGFAHFRVFDYGALTTIGVLAACVAWPVVTRVSSAPRWLFFRLAILVTLAAFVPDLLLIVKGEPVKAVAVLMTMHLGIALVTYNLLVRLARIDPEVAPGQARPSRDAIAPAAEESSRPLLSSIRRLGAVLSVLVGVELALGVVALFLIPLGRPTQVVPDKGRAIYLAHSVIGAALVIGAVVMVRVGSRAGRVPRIAAWVGLSGVGIGAVGGLLAVVHPARIAGMGLMLLGTVVALVGYLMPAIESIPEVADDPA